MRLDSYAKAAAPLYQEAGAFFAERSRAHRDSGDTAYANMLQQWSQEEYEAARQIMEIEGVER